MAKLRKLSKLKPKNYKYAGCGACREIFIRDIYNYGSIYCPNGCLWVLQNANSYKDLKKEINK